MMGRRRLYYAKLESVVQHIPLGALLQPLSAKAPLEPRPLLAAASALAPALVEPRASPQAAGTAQAARTARPSGAAETPGTARTAAQTAQVSILSERPISTGMGRILFAGALLICCTKGGISWTVLSAVSAMHNLP